MMLRKTKIKSNSYFVIAAIQLLKSLSPWILLSNQVGKDSRKNYYPSMTLINWIKDIKRNISRSFTESLGKSLKKNINCPFGKEYLGN